MLVHAGRRVPDMNRRLGRVGAGSWETSDRSLGAAAASDRSGITDKCAEAGAVMGSSPTLSDTLLERRSREPTAACPSGRAEAMVLTRWSSRTPSELTLPATTGG